MIMQKYKELKRTTLGEYLASNGEVDTGIYIIACYPSIGCLYVGISNDVHRRLRQHLLTDKPLSVFLRDNMGESCGFRLDILTAPGNNRQWMLDAERQLIGRLHPMFNERGL